MENLAYTPNMEGKFKETFEVRCTSRDGYIIVLHNPSSQITYSRYVALGDELYSPVNIVNLSDGYVGICFDEYHKLLKEWEEIEMDGKKEAKEEKVKLTIEFDRCVLDRLLQSTSHAAPTEVLTDVVTAYQKVSYIEYALENSQRELDEFTKQKQQEIYGLKEALHSITGS